MREILRRAEEADSEPWNQIYGSIADLLDVDMDNAALLEVALSGRAQLLVVRKLQPFVEYLNSGRGRITGRVGFVSLEESSSPQPGGQNPTGIPQRLRTLAPETSAGDDDFAVSWWSRPKNRFRMLRQTRFRTVSFARISDFLKVMWVDPRTDSPVIRSVFSQLTDRTPLLFRTSGVIGRADGLARSPRHLPSLAAEILADTWVVESLSDALRLH